MNQQVKFSLKRHFVFITIVAQAFLLMSCISNSEVTLVTEDYLAKHEARKALSSEYVEVNLKMTKMEPQITHGRHIILPFYYGRNHFVELPEEWFVEAFKEAMITIYDTAGIYAHTDSTHVTVNFLNVPDSFKLRHNTIIFPYWIALFHKIKTPDYSIRAKLYLTQNGDTESFDYTHSLKFPDQQYLWPTFYTWSIKKIDWLRWYLMTRDEYAEKMAISMVKAIRHQIEVDRIEE